ncbi:hypothetical protein CMS1057 [Clavibacter sepedonicus]|uniref:Uncharacterized protein n=1 Tax=Clavibacter sepedonicus TaxID=31964 RepID=B0RGB5_CLASE|nr:hypothetical protein CMS1057 [Clavibacter sepedonicus]
MSAPPPKSPLPKSPLPKSPAPAPASAPPASVAPASPPPSVPPSALPSAPSAPAWSWPTASGMRACAMAEPTTTPAMVPSMDPAIMPPMPIAAPPPARPPRGPRVRSSVPGARISERVAERASDSGRSSTGASPSAASELSWRKRISRCSGVSLRNASRCTSSIFSGGAVRRRYRYRSTAISSALRSRGAPSDARPGRPSGCSSRPRSLSRNPMVMPLAGAGSARVADRSGLLPPYGPGPGDAWEAGPHRPRGRRRRRLRTVRTPPPGLA